MDNHYISNSDLLLHDITRFIFGVGMGLFIAAVIVASSPCSETYCTKYGVKDSTTENPELKENKYE